VHKPSLDLLRAMSDERMLRAVMARRRVTRAELAVETGLSKPTASDSVRRLTDAGLLVDTGERTTGRGRVGTYYSLAGDVGVALVVDIAPDAVTGEVVDAFGDVVERAGAPIGDAATVLVFLARDLAARAPGPVRTAVVSVADPVDRRTGAVVSLPDSPFLVGELAAAELLAPVVSGPVTVDNDVNWAASTVTGPRDFVYLHLGRGLGAAVVADGEVRRGHRGVAGEIAHLPVTGPDGVAIHLTDVFAQLGLRQPGGTAIDVDAVLATPSAHGVIARAVTDAILAAIAFTDPERILIGGEWGPGLVPAIAEAAARTPRPIPVVAVTAGNTPLTGARTHAIDALRTTIIATTAGVAEERASERG
jgi:predicted NBD/HSP70 family sugar kinase